MSASVAQFLAAIPCQRTARALDQIFTALLADNDRLYASGTWDAASIADGDEVVTEITVTGAALGDFVQVSSSIDVADLNLVGQVTAANTVTVQLNNNTGGAIDLASATIYVVVTPRAAIASPNLIA